jgi:beta-glucosidase
MAVAAIAQTKNSVPAQTHLGQAIAYAEAMGAAIGQEAQAIGLNWVLAPVVDVNNNSANPVINVRAFGESAELVSQLATAFVRGVSRYPVLTAAKHFPGHGDTTVDSHLELPVIFHSQERLQALEQLPFQAAIAAGVDAVMSAHLQIPALDPKFPATLSERILTGGLRQSLGFEGLIVTDALVMGAIANRYGANQAPVLAVAAGADILLMPVDPAGAILAICEAVNAGQITSERIRASVERIWLAKQKVTEATVDAASPLQSLTANLAQPSVRQLATEILSASQQVYTPVVSRLNQPHWTKNCRNLILLDMATDCDYLQQHSPAIALPTSIGYQLQIIDNCTPSFPFGMVDAQHWCPTLLQLFMRGNPFRGSATLTQTAQHWLQFLLQSDQIQAFILYGSPYVLEQFLPELPADVPYVFTYGQMPEAQAIALSALGFAR